MKRRIKGGNLHIINIFYIKLLFDKSIVTSVLLLLQASQNWTIISYMQIYLGLHTSSWYKMELPNPAGNRSKTSTEFQKPLMSILYTYAGIWIHFLTINLIQLAIQTLCRHTCTYMYMHAVACSVGFEPVIKKIVNSHCIQECIRPAFHNDLLLNPEYLLLYNL